MPESSAIDSALIAKLSSDATLAALATNGVYFDEAPQGSRSFVIVSLMDEDDAQHFGQRSFEDALYLVKAVVITTVANANTVIRDAANRIDALLEQTTLTATGYMPMACYREARLRLTEVDEVDPTVRWYHRGGQYPRGDEYPDWVIVEECDGWTQTRQQGLDQAGSRRGGSGHAGHRGRPQCLDAGYGQRPGGRHGLR